MSNLAAAQPSSLGARPTVAQMNTEVMNQIITDELVREYAVKHGISVSNAEVSHQLELGYAQAGGKDRSRQPEDHDGHRDAHPQGAGRGQRRDRDHRAQPQQPVAERAPPRRHPSHAEEDQGGGVRPAALDPDDVRST